MSAEFKVNLRDQLSYLGMTVQELSDKTKISRRTIENYLSKRGSIPPADYACRIASVLGVTVEWLITGHDPQFFYEQSEAAKLQPLIKGIKSLTPKVQEAVQTLVLAASKESN